MVQGREAHLFDRAVDNQVSRLRRKMEEDSRDPKLIQTVWGGGYRLAADVRRTPCGARLMRASCRRACSDRCCLRWRWRCSSRRDLRRAALSRRRTAPRDGNRQRPRLPAGCRASLRLSAVRVGPAGGDGNAAGSGSGSSERPSTRCWPGRNRAGAREHAPDNPPGTGNRARAAVRHQPQGLDDEYVMGRLRDRGLWQTRPEWAEAR
jgi:hypothetical protein